MFNLNNAFRSSLLRFCALTLALVLAAPVVQAGDSAQHSVEWGGQKRSYHLYRPSHLKTQEPVPLVIVLHGGLGSGSQAEKAYNWNSKASAKGFVVAYPDGTGRTWNAGGTCCGSSARNQIDDVGFLTQLIEKLVAEQNIDPKQVFMTGMSNGAAMSYRYACEGKFPVAAFGSVSGDMTFACANPTPVSIIEIHGLADRTIPFKGGEGRKGVAKVIWPPVQQSLDIFRQAGSCQVESTNKQGVVERTDSVCEQNRAVDLITIADAGHQWPGSKARTGVLSHVLMRDSSSTALDATSVLWDFFQQNKLP